MKLFFAAVLGGILAANVFALDSAGRMTPQMQTQLDGQKKVIAQWAANSAVVDAVRAQNARGPLPGMSNAKWRSLKPDDSVVQGFQRNAAGRLLVTKLTSSNGMIREAFLSAAGGEAVAFAQKPSNYLHSKDAKFTVPMTGKQWQGKPEWDKSSASHAVQISTPVWDHGKPIGVLVVGVSMKTLMVP